ncbi:MAG: amino acid permease [DPANN group archaeon]|nr:amino acid permease [DPANN group archaeon]
MAELKRVLNFPSLLLITINSIMGTGIYFLVAAGARYGGPASIISWVIMACFAVYISACFGELSGMFPKAGGVYEYAKQTYGRFFSFLVGWLTFILGNLTIAMLVVGAIQYLLPVGGELVKIGISILFLIIFNYMAYRGMKTSAIMLIAFSVITLIVIFSILILGSFHINPANFHPFFSKGKFAILITIFFIMETFFGWESAVNLAEETNDPEKVIPKALVIGTGIISVIAIALAIVAIGTLGADRLGQSSAPLADIILSFLGEKGREIITLATYLAIIGSVAGWVVSSPRLVLALTRDKLFLSHFDKIHPVHHTPYRAIIFQGITSAILVIVGSGSYTKLLTLLVPMALIMYSIVLFSVTIQRFKNPDHPRPFRVPFGKTGPILMIFVFGALMATWLRVEPGAIHLLNLGLSLLGVGIPLYFLIGLYYDPEMIRNANDLTAYFSLFTEDLLIPRRIRKELYTILGPIEGKTVLEYGCGVGTLTVDLTEMVGPEGKVFAADMSKNRLKITQKRYNRALWDSYERKHGRMIPIYDEELVLRVHSSISRADLVVSIGMLSYVQDIHKILREMNSILPNGGKIIFIEYGDYFKIVPNPEWLENNSIIERIFRESGFSVQVERKKGLFWNYIYVYGIKSENDVAFI